MIVPRYWAEARRQRPRTKGQRQITVRRFGWSDANQGEAQKMADQRADDALRQILAGNELERRELKSGYNGADGVPIREEILFSEGDTILTRNSYGAHCLNTPDVLFADVDFKPPSSSALGCGITLALAVTSIITGIVTHSRAIGFGAFASALLAGFVISKIQKARIAHKKPSEELLVRQRIETALKKFPHWQVRLYQTPAGFRLVATHRLFKPDEPDVAQFFDAIGSDPIYVGMCLRQKCFRARVSPKPWRIGIARHMRPNPGVWPVRPEHMSVRTAWVAEYEKAAENFASCRYLETYGRNITVNTKAAAVCELHDRLSQALSSREIA